MRRSILAATTAAFLLLSANALATATASASLTNLQFTLTDLDTTDAVSPALTFVTGRYPASSAGSSAHSFVSAFADQQSGQDSGTGFGALDTAVAPVSGVAAAASISGSLFDGPISLQASGTSGVYGSQATSTADLGQLFGFDTRFTLSPYTRITLSAVADASASTDTHYGIAEAASAGAEIRLAPYTPLTCGCIVGVQVYAGPPNGTGPFDQAHEDLLLTLDNTTGSPLEIDLYATATESTISPTYLNPAVPEPSSAALLLLGLGAVVVMRRRH
jgi:hypothetical protein